MSLFKKTSFKQNSFKSKGFINKKPMKGLNESSGLISVNALTPEQVPKEFKEYDIARDYKQAVELGNSYPADMPTLIVRQEDNDTYPYSLYVKEDFGNHNATREYRKKSILITGGRPEWI